MNSGIVIELEEGKKRNVFGSEHLSKDKMMYTTIIIHKVHTAAWLENRGWGFLSRKRWCGWGQGTPEVRPQCCWSESTLWSAYLNVDCIEAATQHEKWVVHVNFKNAHINDESVLKLRRQDSLDLVTNAVFVHDPTSTTQHMLPATEFCFLSKMK
jgi:hypothetical protein